MSRNYYTSGQWNCICDVCGKKIKAGEAKHRWDGFIVCPSDFEQRHSQDFVRARQDKISVPFTRPRPPDIFITPVCTFITHSPEYDRRDWILEYCSIDSQRAISGVAVAGCTIAGKNTGGFL